MTIITESLISECQSQRTLNLNSAINKAILNSRKKAIEYNIDYDLNNIDIKKIIINDIILELCNFKKECTIPTPLFFVDKKDYNIEQLDIICEVLKKMEIFKAEKSVNFFKSFLKYIKKYELTYLATVYFKQAANKLALFK
jgi:hypothetical protein